MTAMFLPLQFTELLLYQILHSFQRFIAICKIEALN